MRIAAHGLGLIVFAACGSKSTSPPAVSAPTAAPTVGTDAAALIPAGDAATLEEGHLAIALPAGWRKQGDEAAWSADEHGRVSVMFAGQTEDQLVPGWRDDFVGDGYVVSDPQPRRVAGVPGEVITLQGQGKGALKASADTCFGILQVDVAWDNDVQAAAAKQAFASLALRPEAGSYLIEGDGYDKELDDRGKLPKAAIKVVDDIARAICADAPDGFLAHAADPTTVATASTAQLSRAQLETAIANAGGLQRYVGMHEGPWMAYRDGEAIEIKSAWGENQGLLELTAKSGTWKVTRLWRREVP